MAPTAVVEADSHLVAVPLNLDDEPAPARKASDDRNERRPAVGRSPEPGADTWRLLLIHDGEKPLRIEPFDAVELAIPLIWAPERRAPGE